MTEIPPATYSDEDKLRTVRHHAFNALVLATALHGWTTGSPLKKNLMIHLTAVLRDIDNELPPGDGGQVMSTQDIIGCIDQLAGISAESGNATRGGDGG
jgi:hypothetical protein